MSFFKVACYTAALAKCRFHLLRTWPEVLRCLSGRRNVGEARHQRPEPPSFKPQSMLLIMPNILHVPPLDERLAFVILNNLRPFRQFTHTHAHTDKNQRLLKVSTATTLTFPFSLFLGVFVLTLPLLLYCFHYIHFLNVPSVRVFLYIHRLSSSLASWHSAHGSARVSPIFALLLVQPRGEHRLKAF